MAKDQTKRISSKDLNHDISSNDALKSIDGYSPINAQCSVANVKSLYDSMVTARANETQAEAALSTARDKALNAEWSFHNIILASKDQVKAQFGKDSNELHSMGIKKSSEYKKRASKKKASAVR